MSTPSLRSAPAPDVDSAAFWNGLSEHRVVSQHCLHCAERRVPPMPSCPRCGSTDYRWEDCSGRGRVYSWIVVRMPLGNLTASDLPCTLATVELEEGGRVVGRMLGEWDAAVDVAVAARFADHEGWTELAFAQDDGAR
jgi:uncharacterized OB-fold protein